MPKELFIGQMNRPPIPFPLADPGEYSVVWSDEKLFATFNQKRPALRTYAGIDNRDMNCSVREISVTSEQVESRGRDILRRNFVGNVDNSRAGIKGDRKSTRLNSSH